MKHYLPEKMFHLGELNIKVALIGCGGTGSQVLTHLVGLNQKLIGTGRGSLHVTVYDPDLVSESNIGRQRFYPSDIGFNKATVLVTRINQGMGFNWTAVPAQFAAESTVREDLIISAVDTAKARLEIDAMLKKSVSERIKACYWLDCGNRKSTAQVVLGTVGKIKQPRIPGERRGIEKLPCITELYDLTQVQDENDGPSCSLAEALESQSLMINPMTACWAVALLTSALEYGYLDIHGCFINLEPFGFTALKIDPETWKRMGYRRKEKKLLKVA